MNMKINMNNELILLLLVVIIMYFHPIWLATFTKSILGRVVFIGLILLCAMKNKMCGILVALLFIFLGESVVEGYEVKKRKRR